MNPLLTESHPSTPTPSPRRPRIRRATVGAAAAVALLSAAVGTAYALTLSTGTPATVVAAPIEPAATPAPTATATPAAPVRSAEPPAPPATAPPATAPPATAPPATANPTSAGPPLTFVAGREGRLAVLSTATGRVLRYLTAAGPAGEGGPATMDDRQQTVYFTHATGTCNAPLVAVPYAGGRTTVVDQTPGRHVSPTVDRSHRIAYLSYPCPAEDTQEDRDVVTVRDLGTGRVRGIAIPRGAEVRAMAWVQNRPVLAVVVWRPDLPERPAELRLVDVHRADTVHDGRLVAAADGCVFAQVARRGPRPELAAAEICFIDGRRFHRLVDVDPVAGVRGRVQATLPPGHDFVNSLDVDASGRHLLYMGMAPTGGASAYVLLTGTPRRLARNTTFPSW